MKKILFALAAFSASLVYSYTVRAQGATISTYATVSACNIAVDHAGNVYTASGAHVYRIASGGAETSVVGGGSSYGDGGAATSAQLSSANNVAFDASGNMYVADGGYGVVRKVNASGIISTVAGNHSLGSGYTGDGGAATAARVTASRVCVDIFGNLYIADQPHSVVRKVNTAGIISTVAGNGTSGHTGDGGPATSAKINFYSQINIWGITTDQLGNLYISDGSNYYVRKVNTAGIITTIAGNGSIGHSGVGGPATATGAYFPQGLTTDAAGNLYIAEWQNCVLEVVNTSGILTTVSGNYTISFSGDGGPATAAGMNAVSDVAIDPSGNIYIADCHNGRIRKVTGFALSGSYLTAAYVADSFGENINEYCSGPQINITTRSYNPAYSVKCYYGDGTSNVSSITGVYSGSGFASFTHAYANPGTYRIKTVLMNSGVVFDSLSYTYEFKLCNTLSTQYYYDANGNCIFDAGDSRVSLPSLTEVDSNGIPIDTISSTSGIYYTAYGRPGDIYTFKIISSPGSLHATCPASGIVTDTLQSLVSNTNMRSVAMQCTTTTGYDLGVNAIVPVTGVRDQWGDIYVNNTHCAPEDATVTLHYSKHYKVDMGGGSLDVRPTPSSYTDSTITWNVSGLASSASRPVDLYYAIWVNPDSGLVVGYPARSYYTVYPTIGDVDITNNSQIIIDTVRGGCDPNEMTVTPSGFIAEGIQLKYNINFTNTGNDTTYNVYVMDTLSDNVDISSFRLVMAAANMNILKYNIGGHNILKFDFPGINLLDSADFPQNCSSGLTFTIHAKTGLPLGATIFNHAGVFFDYNPVVTTNSVENIIGGPTLGTPILNTNEVDIFPNPTDGQLIVKTEQDAYMSLTITNTIGQQMIQQEITATQTNINVKSLPAGLYYITLKGDSGTRVEKFVKM